MEILHNNMLPGILTKEVEFFKISDTEAMAIHAGAIKTFRSLDQWIYDVIKKSMCNLNATIEEMEAYVVEHFGGLDGDPDITINGETGNPEFNGTLNKFDLGNGYHLTPCELRVLELIEMPNKLIADKLFVSVATVESHWQNIRTKTGLANKPELTRFATRKGII